MRNILKNIVVFAMVGLFIFSGMCSKHFIHYMKIDIVSLVKTDRDFSKFIDVINSHSTEKTVYHDFLVDVNSYVLRKIGYQIIQKENSVIVRLDNDYLYGGFEKTSYETLNTYADCVKDLYTTSLQNNAQFLFVMEPSKGINKTLPLNIDNYTSYNCDTFVKALNSRNIPTLNLVESMENDGISEEEMFFATDHHWKPESGFWAVGKMCTELHDLYGFEYDKEITDLNNYNVKNYENWFLGSQGKKTGRLFTELGADDISLITPKFETNLVEEQPNKNEVREGDFSESVLFMENIENKDYYNLNPYAVYSGGDFRLQIIKNRLANNNSKVVLVRDSYSCATVPFLSLAVSELHVVDVRDGDYYVGDRVNVYEYIKQQKPDYVIVAYNIGAIGEESSCFNFK
ncbi:MAG: hypothetical protein IJR60_01015 [Eubacterium sp.]|nr:hypothetical protein [Eubacterium sp.]